MTETMKVTIKKTPWSKHKRIPNPTHMQVGGWGLQPNGSPP